MTNYTEIVRLIICSVYADEFQCRPYDKSAELEINFLISRPKHMLWVLKRTVSMRRFF